MTALPDGVYVNLADADYFGDLDRKGSTDFKDLAAENPADWWYRSAHNPDHKRDPSDEMQFGSALHVLVLEGETEFAARVAVKPAEYPDPKTGELKPWHGAAGFCKAWEAEHKHQIQITGDAERAVRHMTALALHHPQLGPVLRQGLPEVAILWTDSKSGLRLRAKIDYLLPRFCIDLKSFGGDAKGLSVKQQCLSLVAQRSMDLQRFLYFKAREQMARLIEAGCVFGATVEQRVWLTRVAEVEDWQWVWLFYRRRDDGRGYAPVIKPIIRSHFDITFETGRQKLELAIANYQTLVERFGLETPWAVIEPAEEPDDHEFPAWMKNVPQPFRFTKESA